jgi:hypothetical protein
MSMRQAVPDDDVQWRLRLSLERLRATDAMALLEARGVEAT